MLRSFLLFCILWIVVPSIQAQDYYYKTYDVDILVKTDGALEVTETMEVHFNEERRGIIRSIPVIYQLRPLPAGEEQAFRPAGGASYRLIMKDVDVPGDPFIVYDESYYKKIRIGDPTVYHKGDKNYTLKYTVFGAFNEFDDRVELVWNVMGDEHETYTREATFRLRFEEALNFEPSDILILGGRRGESKDIADYQVSPGLISGKSKGKLRRGEGITAGVAIPKDYFERIYIHPEDLSENYYVDHHEAVATVQNDGRIHVEESFDVVFKYAHSFFERTFTHVVHPAADYPHQYLFIENEYLRSNAGKVSYRHIRGGETPGLAIRSMTGAFNGKVRFELSYDIAGAIYPAGGDQHRVYFDVVQFGGDEPLNHSHFTLQAPEGGSFETRDLYFSSDGKTLERISSEANARGISGSIQWDARHINDFHVGALMTAPGMSYETLPPEVFYEDYLVEDYSLTFGINDDKQLTVGERYDVKYKYAGALQHFRPLVPREYEKSDFRTATGGKAYPGRNILKSGIDRVATVEDISDRFKTYKFDEYYTFRVDNPEEYNDRVFSIDYHTRDNYVKSDGGYVFTTKLSNSGEEPVNRLHITWPTDVFSEVRNAYVRVDDNFIAVPLEEVNGEIVGQLDGLISNNSDPLIVQFEAQPVSDLSESWMSRMISFLGANKNLLISLIWSFLLWLLWFFVGRDKKWKRSVAFEPPIGMTPAEAGYIWDGIIHRKDLVSLIYFWAASDLLEIEEIKTDGKSDFKLYKMKDLPPDAQSFERIMFDGLFEDDDEILVSDTRNSLYTTMRKAHKDLKRFGKKYRFWVAGTRELGIAMIIFGMLLGAVGLLTLGFSAAARDFSYAVPILIGAIALIGFGIIMPRKSKMGTEVYHELLSFREFIQTANIHDLEELYQKDSDYFNRTVSFAIVMGLGEEWAKKFKDLIKEPPRYVRNYDPNSPWDTIIYTNWIMSGMHRMNRDFNYSMPSSSGSSSWGGSGGSFGGGGFSGGGGFGGGGSSSW